MRERLQSIADSKVFHRAILAVILCAATLVGIETYPTAIERHGRLLHLLDVVILAIFTVELTIRIGAYGAEPWRFFRDPWNVFDFAIVAISLLPLQAQYIAVLRLVRVLRALRLITALPRLQLIVSALFRSLPSMGYVALLLLLFFYVYAVLGTLLFRTNDPFHFADLQTSLLTLFRVVTLEDWTDVMYSQIYGVAFFGDDAQRAMNPTSRAMPVLGTVYFVSFVVLGTMIMLNLFIGVVVNGMNEVRSEAEAKERSKHLRESGGITPSDELLMLEHKLDELKRSLIAVRHHLHGDPRHLPPKAEVLPERNVGDS